MKLSAVFIMVSVIIGCATKPIEKVPGFEQIIYQPENSLAQNVLRQVYTNRYISDARFGTSEWQTQLSSNYNYFAEQMQTRSSTISKLLTRAVNLDTTRPFDQPNIISWIPVDSVAEYGDKRFNQMVFSVASDYILDSINADLESSYSAENASASVEFKGKFCRETQSRLHPHKIQNGKWTGSGESVTCFINFKHEIIRPVATDDWMPAQLNRENGQLYVLVRTRMANFEAYLYGKELANSFVFFPPKRTTHKRGRSITTGKSTPFMLHRENIYLFVKPYNGNEANIAESLWVTGNKLP